MSDIILYSAPGTCARVPTILLEEIGVAFESRLIRFMKGEHKSPGYKTYNPKGKVPCLVIDGQALTENVAIIGYLNSLYPDSHLMPEASSELDKARQTADLCFCSATLHPLVTRIRMPHMFADERHASNIWQKACTAMNEYFHLVNQHLADKDWWYGDAWSAMDAYLFWVYWRVAGANFDVSPFPHFTDHYKRMNIRPAVQGALAREDKQTQILKSEGLLFVPPSITQ